MLDSRNEPEIELEPGRERTFGVELSEIRAVFVSDLGLHKPVVFREDGEPDLEASRAAVGVTKGFRGGSAYGCSWQPPSPNGW
jgi:hypothetical protein